MENIFKTLRMEKGLTQKEVAEKLYISPMSVSRWESGKSYPEYEILPKLAELYGVPLARLFGGAETNTNYLLSTTEKGVERILRNVESLKNTIKDIERTAGGIIGAEAATIDFITNGTGEKIPHMMPSTNYMTEYFKKVLDLLQQAERGENIKQAGKNVYSLTIQAMGYCVGTK